MYNSYSIESFINHINNEDEYVSEGIKEISSNAWKWIKEQFEKLWNFITHDIPLKIKGFLDKNPKLRNLPGIKKIYARLEKLKTKTKNTGNEIKKNEKTSNNEKVNEVKEELKDEITEAKEILNDFKTIVEGGGSDYTNIAYSLTKDDADKVDKKIKKEEDARIKNYVYLLKDITEMQKMVYNRLNNFKSLHKKYIKFINSEYLNEYIQKRKEIENDINECLNSFKKWYSDCIKYINDYKNNKDRTNEIINKISISSTNGRVCFNEILDYYKKFESKLYKALSKSNEKKPIPNFDKIESEILY